MLSDLRLTFRTLAKSPTFVIVAVVTLGLGIGINTAIYSLLNAIAWRGMPFPEQHELVVIRGTNDAQPGDRLGASRAEFEDFRQWQTSFGDLAAVESNTASLSGLGGDPERIRSSAISASGVAALPGPLALGRWFSAEDDKVGAPATVVLTHALWINRFKSDPSILGQQVKINNEWSTIIGVAAAGFRFPELADAFVPLRGLRLADKRDIRALTVFGRLKPGVSLQQAQTEVAALGQRLTAEHPETNKGITFQGRTMHEHFAGTENPGLLRVMLGAVFFVMFIACANVANLLLARAAVREKELAVRAALGAGRARVVRLLLAESSVLALGGAALGVLIAIGCMALLRHYAAPANPPFWMVFEVDGSALLYTGGLAFAACLLAGLYPALRSSRPDLNAVLKDAGRGSTGSSLGKFTRVMIVGEVALSCLLLVLSGLTIRTVVKTQSEPTGFAAAGVYTGRVALLDAEYAEPAKQRQFYARLIERLRTRAEIADFALADLQPTWDYSFPIILDGRAPEPEGHPALQAGITAVSGGYFSTLGVALLQGRDINDADTAEAPRVAVVSTAFGEKYWPGENPIGRRFRQGAGREGEEVNWITVVGLVKPTMVGRFKENPQVQAYVPYTQYADVQSMTIYAKARSGEAAALAPVVRQVVRELNENLPVYSGQTLDQMIDQARFSKRLVAWIFGAFGGVALTLAAVGLYGVMSYSVAQRTQEIGVRVALGATPRDVLSLILKQGGRQLALGLVIGLVAAYFAGQLIGVVLYNVSPRDPGTFLVTVLALGGAGLIATLIPALRALRINPVEALRNE